MRIYNKYVITIALVSGIINSLLALLGQSDLGIYFIINVLAYLVITLLYVHFNPRARMALNSIGVILFGGFAVIVIIKAMEFLSSK
ncbi:hypothetical protein ACFLW0_00905 [Chloroflexota bacterium]